MEIVLTGDWFENLFQVVLEICQVKQLYYPCAHW